MTIVCSETVRACCLRPSRTSASWDRRATARKRSGWSATSTQRFFSWNFICRAFLAWKSCGSSSPCLSWKRQGVSLENLALRQQLTVLKRQYPRPRLRRVDRLFWVWLSTVWSPWRQALMIVHPETVVSWHRKGFRLYWTWISRRCGRPEVSTEIRALIRRMAQANPFWEHPGFTENY